MPNLTPLGIRVSCASKMQMNVFIRTLCAGTVMMERRTYLKQNKIRLIHVTKDSEVK